MSNLMQATTDPQQLARMRAMMALFPGQQQPLQVSDENPTSPQPAQPLSGASGAAQTAGTTSQAQPGASSASQPSLSTPGAISRGVSGANTPSGAKPANSSPSVPTFADYSAANAPAPEPTFSTKDRVLHALFAGGVGALSGAAGNPNAGADYYQKWSHPNETAFDKQQAIDAKLHTGYENTVADTEAPTKFDQLKAQVADAEAQAQQRQADADKAEAAAKNPQVKLQRAVIADADGNPKSVDFNPQTGQYLDPDTQQPIQGAKQWEKPQAAGTLEDQISRTAADISAKGGDPTTDPRMKPLIDLYRTLHPEQPNFASVYPQIRGAEALEKPSTDYTNFLSQTGAVKADIGKAQDGNQLANALAPLGEALMVTGAGGVHRINMTEINRAGDAQMGSLARRVDAALEKAGNGKLPADTLREMGELVDMYSGYKYKAYLQQARVTAANFKLGDVPVISQDGNDFIPLSQAMKSAGFRGPGVAAGGSGSVPTFKEWQQSQSKAQNTVNAPQ